MNVVLALALALSSSVIGALVGRARRPAGAMSLKVTMVVAVVAAAVAETATILWVGAPRHPLQPVIGGILIGLASGMFSGRKTPPSPPPPPDSSM